MFSPIIWVMASYNAYYDSLLQVRQLRKAKFQIDFPSWQCITSCFPNLLPMYLLASYCKSQSKFLINLQPCHIEMQDWSVARNVGFFSGKIATLILRSASGLRQISSLDNCFSMYAPWTSTRQHKAISKMTGELFLNLYMYSLQRS